MDALLASSCLCESVQYGTPPSCGKALLCGRCHAKMPLLEGISVRCLGRRKKRGLGRFFTPHSLNKCCGTEVVGFHLLEGTGIEHFNVLLCCEATTHQKRLEKLQQCFEIFIHRCMRWHPC